MNDFPKPLVSSDCDCTDLDGFMLNVERLMASELVALGTHEEIAAALFLWCRAWKQVPAASLPDDDRVNAAFARLPISRFRKVKETILRGFVKCSDGRLYHRFLSGEAQRAFERKKAFRKKRETDSERLRKWRGSKSETHNETHNETHIETQSETRFVAEGQGQGQGQGEERKDGGADAPPLAFVGRVVRLTFTDFERWRTTFAAIPDIRAELEAADAHYADKPPPNGKWFFPVSNWLKRAHEQALAKQREEISARRSWN